MAPYYDDGAVQAALGKRKRKVNLTERGHKGGSAPKHKWTDEEREIVRRDYALTHASKREIALRLSVTQSAVAGQIAKMGIAKRTDRRPWTPEEDNRLGDLICRYAPIGVASRMGRSVNSVVVRAWRLGYSRRLRDGWYTKKDVCQMLGVDQRWVQRRIDRGELTATYRNGLRPKQNGSACWQITQKDLRQFIIGHCSELNGRNIDLFDVINVLIDLGK